MSANIFLGVFEEPETPAISLSRRFYTMEIVTPVQPEVRSN